MIMLMKKNTFMFQCKKAVTALFFVFLVLPNVTLGMCKMLMLIVYCMRKILILIMKGGISFVRPFELGGIQGFPFWQTSASIHNNTAIVQG